MTVGFPGTGSAGSSAPLTVRATSPGSPTAVGTATLQRFAGALDDVQPSSGRAPVALRPGDTVTLTGSGLCPGSVIRFGNPNGSVAPTAAAFTAGGTGVAVEVPRFATTGPITVVSPDGTFASAGAFTVRDYRNTSGFSFDNYGGGDVTISDLQDVYGTSQTNITLDLCWPFGCDVVTPLVSPFTYLYKVISNEFLAGKGSCFGMSLMSQRLAEGYAHLSSFAPAGATTTWQLDGPGGPSPALTAAIRGWHSAQLSSEFIQYWTAHAVANAANGGSSTRATLESQLQAGHHPLVVLRNSPSDGHVLVASDVRDGAAPGEYLIDVNDPNLPFLAGETSPDGALHHDREEAGVIHVAANGHWTNVGAYGSTWSGGPGSLVVAPWGTLPARPTMPTTLTGLLSLILPFATQGARSTQLTDAHGHALLGAGGDLNTDPATRIPGAEVLTGITGRASSPLYAVPARSTYTQTLRGTGHGTTGTSILAPGFAGQLTGVGTAAGKTDTVRLAPSTGELAVTSPAGGDLRAQLARQARGAEYGADVHVVGGDPGRHAFVLDTASGTFRYTTGAGPARADVTLSWAGPDGSPATVRLGLVAVPAGGTAVIAPRNWHDLSASAQVVTVRDAHHRLVSTRTVRPRRAARHLRGVTVKAVPGSGRSRTFTIRARFRGVPRSAGVLVVLDVLRGHRVVAARVVRVAAARARGTRTVTFRVPLARGTFTVRGGVVLTTAGSVPMTERAGRSITYRAR